MSSDTSQVFGSMWFPGKISSLWRFLCTVSYQRLQCISKCKNLVSPTWISVYLILLLWT